MADIKKILIFSGITLAVVGGGIFAYKVLDDKKKAKAKAEKDSELTALKAKLRNPTTTYEEREDAKVDITSLIAAPAIGLGSKLLSGLIDKLFEDKPKKKPTNKAEVKTGKPAPTLPDVDDEDAWDLWLNEDYDYYDVAEEENPEEGMGSDYNLDEVVDDSDNIASLDEEDEYVDDSEYEYDYSDDEDYYDYE